MAISKPNLTRIWAADAAGSDVVDPDVQTPGKFALGWGAEKPPYQFFNFMQKLFTQGLGYFDEQGIAFWNTDTDYQNFSITKGSNGSLYFLKASGDGTEDPVDDAGVNWTPLPTRAEVDAKANQATTYTKTEANTLLNDKYSKSAADILLNKKSNKASETTVTDTATFTNSTNNIALTGIGSIGLEIGDVVQVTGTASNNKLFTVEVITDSGNVIVNQAHAGGTTSKSLRAETADAVITLFAKWFNAPTGLGQGVVDVTSLRAIGVVYTGIPNRQIFVMISENSTTGNRKFFIGGEEVFIGGTSSANDQLLSVIIPAGSTYEFRVGQNINFWSELR